MSYATPMVSGMETKPSSSSPGLASVKSNAGLPHSTRRRRTDWEGHSSGASAGFGLRAMRERVGQLGGSCSVEGTRGDGVTVSVSRPAFRTETFRIPDLSGSDA